MSTEKAAVRATAPGDLDSAAEGDHHPPQAEHLEGDPAVSVGYLRRHAICLLRHLQAFIRNRLRSTSKLFATEKQE
jgi:hypothetical protein